MSWSASTSTARTGTPSGKQRAATDPPRCRTIADWGRRRLLRLAEDGENFYRDLTWLCLHQHGAFNSPVWFNVGLHHQYGVTGAKCNWHWDNRDGQAASRRTRTSSPGSACFIQSVGDNMEDIMRWRPARRCSSSSARAPAPIFRPSARIARSSPAAASPRGRCRSCGSTTRSPRSSSRAARRAAPPRCSRSRSGTPTSRVHRVQVEGREEGTCSDREAGTRRTSTAKPTARSSSRTPTSRSASPMSS
jgi:hypothetical protein